MAGSSERPTDVPDQRLGPSYDDDRRDTRLAAADVPRRDGAAEAQPESVKPIQAFTADLYRSLAAQPGNVVCSPYSVAVALAMTRNGARGTTADELDAVLHAPDLDILNAGLNALSHVLESRAGERERRDGSRADVSLESANSLWGQRDTTWLSGFLEPLAADYGSGIHLVDFVAGAEEARAEINAWTADRTHGRIEQIVPGGVIDADTRLLLVNAVYLKAPWAEPFGSGRTQLLPFTRSDGSEVDVPMMAATLKQAWVGAGTGWQTARLEYADGGLAMTVVLPEASLAELEESLDAELLAELLTAGQPVPALSLQLPRWTFRRQLSLGDALAALGMPTAFDPGQADFSAMTADERLCIKAVVHEAFVAVDEEGTEASAATAVVIVRLSMPLPVVITVDRPFLFVIHDVETATPVFIGRVTDPTDSD